MADVKEWWKSKTVWGAILIAGSVIMKVAGDFLQGNVDPGTLLNEVLPQIGIILSIIGLRTMTIRLK